MCGFTDLQPRLRSHTGLVCNFNFELLGAKLLIHPEYAFARVLLMTETVRREQAIFFNLLLLERIY